MQHEGEKTLQGTPRIRTACGWKGRGESPDWAGQQLCLHVQRAGGALRISLRLLEAPEAARAPGIPATSADFLFKLHVGLSASSFQTSETNNLSDWQPCWTRQLLMKGRLGFPFVTALCFLCRCKWVPLSALVRSALYGCGCVIHMPAMNIHSFLRPSYQICVRE